MENKNLNIHISDKYIEMPNIVENGKILSNKYPDKFNDLPFDGIKCFARIEPTNTTNNKKQKLQSWTTSFLPQPLIDLFGIHAIIFLDFDYYSSLNEAQISLLCADIFISLTFDKALFLKPFEVKDNYDILNNFGLNYLENPESPNIIQNNWNWR
jgi:hypothetical protein